MAVYVDDWRHPTRRRSAGCVAAWVSGWSHLFADSRAELEAFADQLHIPGDLRRVEPSGVRCEVSEGVRLRAIRLGAIPLRLGSPGWLSVVRRSRFQQTGARVELAARCAV